MEKHASHNGGEPEEAFSQQMLTQGKKIQYIQKIKLTIDEWQVRKLPVTRLSQEPTLHNMDYFGSFMVYHSLFFVPSAISRAHPGQIIRALSYSLTKLDKLHRA